MAQMKRFGPKITQENLGSILRAGETQHYEFKLKAPRTSVFASALSAFSNATGGTLLVGADDSGHVVGADLLTVRSSLEEAEKLVSPSLSTQVYEIPFQGKKVVAVEIEPSPLGPTLVDGVALVRDGPSMKPLSAEWLKRSLSGIADVPEVQSNLAEAIARQSDEIMRLRHQIIKASSWRAKLPELLLGGVIGAVVGVALTIALGI